jgi:hypothetical protein
MSISLLLPFFPQELLYTGVAGVAIFGMEKEEDRMQLQPSRDTPTTKIRQHNTTRYAGCEFHIKIVHPTNNDSNGEVLLLTSFIFNVL